jgi:hypothetical protein
MQGETTVCLWKYQAASHSCQLKQSRIEQRGLANTIILFEIYLKK